MFGINRLQTLFVLFNVALLAQARPVRRCKAAAAVSGKRLLLWDYTLTNAYKSNSNIQAAAALLAGSVSISAVFNWNSWKPHELPDNIPFEPMIRGPAQLSGSDWTFLQESLASGSVKTIHFYDEPDLKGVSPADAISAWINNVLPLRDQHGVKLVGPAVASNDAGSDWLKEFYSGLSQEQKPDYLGLHFYTGQDTPADTEVENAKAYITAKYEQFQLPCIISEIGSTSRDPASVETFTKETSAWLDTLKWVVSYGFFGATTTPVDGFVSPAAQLIDSSGSWTTLGRWWISH